MKSLQLSMNMIYFIIKNKLNNYIIVDEVLERTKALEPDKPEFKTQLSTYCVWDIKQVI